MTDLASSILDKHVKVVLSDERIFYGIIKCVDFKGNIVLSDIIVEVPMKFVSPLNKYIQLTADQHDAKKVALEKLIKDPADREKVSDSFWVNRYLTSGFILPRQHIVSIHEII